MRVAHIAQGPKLAAVRQRDRIVEDAGPAFVKHCVVSLVAWAVLRPRARCRRYIRDLIHLNDGQSGPCL
jgi:hypothetical protein